MADKENKVGVEQGTGAETQRVVDAKAERVSTADQIAASRELAAQELAERSTPADISPAAAKDFESSGAVTEPQIKRAIDVDHPAVDNNPRAGTTERQNRVDFNDQSLDDQDAVAQNLGNQ